MTTADLSTEKISNLAERYAVALYALADDAKLLDQVTNELRTLRQLIDESRPLSYLIGSRTVPLTDASAAMSKILQSQGFSDLVRRYVLTIIANRRISALPQLISGFIAYAAKKRGIATADVATAHPLSAAQRAQLAARLAEVGYGRVQINEHVDPTLLGGLVVKIDSRLYDTSLKSRLQRLGHVMKGAA